MSEELLLTILQSEVVPVPVPFPYLPLILFIVVIIIMVIGAYLITRKRG